jgi:hypothetical protein
MQKSQWTLKKNSNYKKSIKDVAVILKTANYQDRHYMG